MTLAAIGIVAFTLLAGYFAGVETGMYSINRLRIRFRAEQGERGAIILQELAWDIERLLATTLVGHNMALRLEEAGKSGVIDSYSFDGYWVGSTRSTCFWKNTVGILTEVASARLASPIHIDPMELRGDRKGLAEYRAQVNFPNPCAFSEPPPSF